jgi:hypothetical protein
MSLLSTKLTHSWSKAWEHQMTPLWRRIICDACTYGRCLPHRQPGNMWTRRPHRGLRARNSKPPSQPSIYPLLTVLQTRPHFLHLSPKDTTICVATSVPDSRMRLSEGRSMCMINRSKAGHSLQDFRLSKRYCLKIQVFSVVTLSQCRRTVPWH